MIIMLICDFLTDLGCEIAGVAVRFMDALDKARSQSFDVAILDVNLNGQHVFPIAEVLAERGMAFVFSTGYGSTGIPARFESAPVLQKPFRQEDLEQALRTALAISGG